jgi:hypothetical protein
LFECLSGVCSFERSKSRKLTLSLLFASAFQKDTDSVVVMPTSEPPIATFDLFELLVDKSEGLRRSDSIGDMESPQYKASSWLLELYGDQIQPVQEATVVETFALATLYHATNGTRWFNSDNWLSLTKPTCSWYLKGINCNNHN